MATATATFQVVRPATASATFTVTNPPGTDSATFTVLPYGARASATFIVTPMPSTVTATFTALNPSSFHRVAGVYLPARDFIRKPGGTQREATRFRRVAGAWKALGLPLAVKPGLAGLTDRWNYPSAASTLYAPQVGSFVVQVLWRDLQPAANGQIVTSALTYDSTNRTSGKTLAETVTLARSLGLKIRLRVMCGYRAPAWALALGGTPMPWYDSTATTATMGRWWRADYKAAIRDLNVKLAALYDLDPVIADVVISGHSTIFTEMNRQVAVNPSIAASYNPRNSLVAALSESEPYSKDFDVLAMQDYILMHSQVWLHTASSLAVNPFQSVTDATHAPSSDVLTTKNLMDYAVGVLGTRATFGNHSIRDNQQPGGLAGNDMATYNALLVNDLYVHMAAKKAAGASIYFQTDAPPRLGRLASSTPQALTTVSVAYPGGNVLVRGGPALDLILSFTSPNAELPDGYGSATPTYAGTAFTSYAQAGAYRTALLANV